MFQAPDWEDDVPTTHTIFMKKTEKKGKNNVDISKKVTLKVNKVKVKKQIQPKVDVVSKLKKPKESKPIKQKPKIFKVNNVTEKISNNTVSNGIDNATRKRKLDHNPVNTKKKKSKQSTNTDTLRETQDCDEILLNEKKKKFNEIIENDDQIDLLFTESKQKIQRQKINKQNGEQINSLSNGPINVKKNKLKVLLDSNRRSINVANSNNSNTLRNKMLERLKAAQFRYLNEKLYTSSGSDARKMFQEDPVAFKTYHEGYQQQVKKWPVNPLNIIVKKIKKLPKSYLVADMGCGEAALSQRIPHTVRSFDLVATAPGVEVCDMAKTPLLTGSMDVVVYCLALMGTELTQYLIEANRVMKVGGHLLIAEVESRFDNVENFTKGIQRLGFKLKQLDKSNSVFFFMMFTKIQDSPVKKSKLPELTLKPCIYKRR